MYARLDHITDVAPGIQTFWFRPETPFRYTAGEFVEMTLPHDEVDDRGHRRWFTLSSSPHEELIAITTRLVDLGSSFKQALRHLQPGIQVLFSEPLGDFVLPKDKTIPMVFVAAGLGITPVHSITKWLEHTGEQRSITLFQVARTEGDLAFRDLFEQQYGALYIPVLTRPAADWQGARGPLTIASILEQSRSSERTMFYMSGPEAMIQAFEKGLRQAGIDPFRIITDYFPGYPEA